MDLGIKGRTALVLGGGGGLGRAIAVALAREGANVALGDVNAEALAQSKDAVTAAGGRALPLEWNLADHASFEQHFTVIEKTLGPVDILINNTGGPPPTPAAGQDAALWLKSFQEMVLSVIAITDRALPQMRSPQVGAHHHQHFLRRRGADPESRHLECDASFSGRVVEDPGAGSGT